MTAEISRQALIRIVDDDRDFSEGLSFMLESLGWRTAVYERAADFLRQDAPSVPGCLILDIRMPEMSGIELQAEMKRRSIDLPIIILTGNADVESAVRTLKMGAMDFLQKPVESEELFESVSEAVRLSEIKSAGGLDREAIIAVLRGFPAREKQVTVLLLEGLANSAIAERLGLTPKTVQNYRNTVYGKLRVHNTEGLFQVLTLVGDEQLREILL